MTYQFPAEKVVGCRQARSDKKKVDFEVDKNGCFICTSHTKQKPVGYFQVWHNGRRNKLHVYIYEMMFGLPPKDHIIRHKCDNPMCINPEHLESGTFYDNNRDIVERGRRAKEIPRKTHLTAEQAAEIRAMEIERGDMQKVAEQYKVSYLTIWRIRTGRR